MAPEHIEQGSADVALHELRLRVPGALVRLYLDVLLLEKDFAIGRDENRPKGRITVLS